MSVVPVTVWMTVMGGQASYGGVLHRPPPSVDSISQTISWPEGCGVRAIYAGENHACALTGAGGLKCWGSNDHGQLGRGGTRLQDAITPVDVTGLTSGVTAVAAGQHHTCALTSAGGVKCWGANGSGQLGIGRQTASMTAPLDVVGLGSGVRMIASSGDHTCAIDRAA